MNPRQFRQMFKSQSKKITEFDDGTLMCWFLVKCGWTLYRVMMLKKRLPSSYHTVERRYFKVKKFLKE